MTEEEQDIIQKAFNEGKKIQTRPWGADDWRDEPCPDWDWDEYEYRIEETDLTLLDIHNSSMYNKFIIANNGLTLLRIADIEYIGINDACNDIAIHMKSTHCIYETKNVIFYDKSGDKFKIDTAFDDGQRVAEACARVNGQLLIRLLSLQ